MVETKTKKFFFRTTYPLYGAQVIDENLNLLLRGMSEKKTIFEKMIYVSKVGQKEKILSGKVGYKNFLPMCVCSKKKMRVQE